MCPRPRDLGKGERLTALVTFKIMNVCFCLGKRAGKHLSILVGEEGENKEGREKPAFHDKVRSREGSPFGSSRREKKEAPWIPYKGRARTGGKLKVRTKGTKKDKSTPTMPWRKEKKRAKEDTNSREAGGGRGDYAGEGGRVVKIRNVSYAKPGDLIKSGEEYRDEQQIYKETSPREGEKGEWTQRRRRLCDGKNVSGGE